jgi:membrane-bound lytic murein transglycosylase D
MRIIIATLLSILFIASCSVNKLTNEEQQYEAMAEDSSENRESVLAEKNVAIDSLSMLVENLYFMVDSLMYELDVANSRVAVNTEFQIPDRFMFAGREFDFSNDRVYAKFERIFAQELKSAHRYIQRSGIYFDIFEEYFEKYDIPSDAKFLAVAESDLNAMATSHVGAAGIWQIMPSTAKGLGLQINSFIDERRDIFKATDAAARFLRGNYNFLAERGAEDWLLAMSSYNAGVGNISRAIREQQAYDFFDIMMRTDETHHYLWRAVAIKMIFEHEVEIFGQRFTRDLPLREQTRVETLNLKGHYKIDNWAAAQGTSVRRIWELNPWIKIYQRSQGRYSAINDVVLPPGDFTILVPIEAEKDRVELERITKQFQNENAGYFTHHIVQKGDTLFGIARKYNTSVSSLRRLNGLNSDLIRPGQKLYLFDAPSGSASSSTNTYEVKSGDTVSTIAQKLGVSTNHLITMNNLRNNNGVVLIYPGQKLSY